MVGIQDISLLYTQNIDYLIMSEKLYRIVNLIVFSLIILNGCQQEVVEIIEPPKDQVITPNSAVADLVERTSLKDGSLDNVLDHASCISLVLPVTVRIEEEEIMVKNQDDLKMIEDFLREEEHHEVELIYPVTVILADYTEVMVNDEDELEDLGDDCRVSGEDDDIECVDFKYPVTLSVYDTENQLSEVVTVTSDQELYELFEYFDDDKICSFKFPITVVLAGGEEVIINNNDELESILEDAVDKCDEEDDHYEDHSGMDDHTGIENPDLSAVLSEGTWVVAEYQHAGRDETGNYQEYEWTFNSEGQVTVSDGSGEIAGTWSSITDSGTLYLVFDFGETAPFVEFSEDWEILEYNYEKVDLRNVSGGDGSVDRLVLERI